MPEQGPAAARVDPDNRPDVGGLLGHLLKAPPMRIRTKICGLTRPEDVAVAVAAGVDALGFNFAGGPRLLSVEAARPLVARVPPFVARIGLFVDADYLVIRKQMTASGCTVVQLHGNEPAELARALAKEWPVIKAFRIRDAADLDRIAGYPADAYLLDAYVPGQAGGTGQAWDHRLLAERSLDRPVILAGGLRPDNVAAAIASCRPWAVDTASGVESEPGIKDPTAVRAFIDACSAA